MPKNKLKKFLFIMTLISLTGCGSPDKQEEPTTNINNEATSQTNVDSLAIENEIQKQNYDQATKMAREYFTNTIDFIFYGKVVNGQTFNDLSAAEKQAVLNELYTIDNEIMAFDPTYKEDLGEKYNSFKDFTSEKYQGLLNIIREQIGDDTYNKIGNTKNEVINGIKENSKNLGKRLQTDAKKWYESEFKN